MSLPLVAKVSAGVVGVGTVVGGGTFVAYKSLNQETITKYLNSLHRELAVSEEDWELIKTNYSIDKDENPTPNIPRSSIGNKLKELKKWCSDSIGKKFSQEEANNGDYDLIQTWCTKQVKISVYLKHLKLASLDTKGTGDDSILTKLKDSYSNSVLKINEITEQNSNKSEGTSILNTIEDIKKIKDWCSWASEQYFKHKKDTLFKRYEHFCTKPI